MDAAAIVENTGNSWREEAMENALPGFEESSVVSKALNDPDRGGVSHSLVSRCGAVAFGEACGLRG